MEGKKVLVIDDNPVVIHFTENLLKSKGFSVIVAGNGEAGIRRAKAEQPDVVLLDIILPEKHGFEVCRDLRRDDATKDIPIIMMTSSGLEDVASKEPEIQAEGYLAKPFKWDDIEVIFKKIFS